jgi:hypothetical protein
MIMAFSVDVLMLFYDQAQLEYKAKLCAETCNVSEVTDPEILRNRLTPHLGRAQLEHTEQGYYLAMDYRPITPMFAAFLKDKMLLRAPLMIKPQRLETEVLH